MLARAARRPRRRRPGRGSRCETSRPGVPRGVVPPARPRSARAAARARRESAICSWIVCALAGSSRRSASASRPRARAPQPVSKMQERWPNRRASSSDRVAAAAGHDDDLDVRAQARLERARAEQRQLAVARRASRPPPARAASRPGRRSAAHRARVAGRSASLAWTDGRRPQTEPWSELLRPAGPTSGSSREAFEGARAADAVADPRRPAPDGCAAALAARGIERALLAPGRGAATRARDGRRRSSPPAPRRASRCASTCRCSTCSPRPDARARSTSTRPRRSPRTRRASSPRCGLAGAAPGDLRRRHAARGARRRSAGARTSCSPTPTCSTSAILPHHTALGRLPRQPRAASSSTRRTSTAASSARTSPTCCAGCGGSPRAYGTEPRFLLASATIANPVELAERLTGLDVRARRRTTARRSAGARDRDVEPAGDRRAHRRRGARRSAEAADLLADLVARGRADDLLHAQPRAAIELIQRFARDAARGASASRAGRPDRPLPRRLHARSSGARSRRGSPRGELLGGRRHRRARARHRHRRARRGDLRHLPRHGRQPAPDVGPRRAPRGAGSPSTSPARTRSTSSSAATPTSSSSARSRRRSSTTSNEQIHARAPARRRLRGAARAPTTTRSSAPGWRERAERLVAAGELRAARRALPAARRGDFPAGRDLAALGLAPTASRSSTRDSGELLGSVEAERAFSTVHPGAVYLHLGRSYEVARARPRRAPRDRRSRSTATGTRSRRRRPRSTSRGCATQPRGARASSSASATSSVTEQVIAYQRKRLADHEVIDLVALDLPEQNFVTQALWYELAGASSRGDAAARGAARRAARRRARADRGAAADRDVRPLGHRRPLDQRPPPDRPPDDLHLRRPPRRRRDHAARLRASSSAWSATRDRLIGECPCEAGCPSCVQSPEVRQPQRAAAQGRRARADGADARGNLNGTSAALSAPDARARRGADPLAARRGSARTVSAMGFGSPRGLIACIAGTLLLLTLTAPVAQATGAGGVEADPARSPDLRRAAPNTVRRRCARSCACARCGCTRPASCAAPRRGSPCASCAPARRSVRVRRRRPRRPAARAASASRASRPAAPSSCRSRARCASAAIACGSSSAAARATARPLPARVASSCGPKPKPKPRPKPSARSAAGAVDAADSTVPPEPRRRRGQAPASSPFAARTRFGGDRRRASAPGRTGHIHEGQDIIAASGTPVVAPLAGDGALQRLPGERRRPLRRPARRQRLGHVFAHCRAGSATLDPGARVAAGDQLCLVGATGQRERPAPALRDLARRLATRQGHAPDRPAAAAAALGQRLTDPARSVRVRVDGPDQISGEVDAPPCPFMPLGRGAAVARDASRRSRRGCARCGRAGRASAHAPVTERSAAVRGHGRTPTTPTACTRRARTWDARVPRRGRSATAGGLLVFVANPPTPDVQARCSLGGMPAAARTGSLRQRRRDRRRERGRA